MFFDCHLIALMDGGFLPRMVTRIATWLADERYLAYPRPNSDCSRVSRICRAGSDEAVSKN